MSDFYEENDNKFRDKLTEHEFAKMPGAWEQMEKMLQAEPATSIKSGAIFWWSFPLAAAAVLTGIIGIGIYMNPKTVSENIENQVLAQQTSPSSIKNNNTISINTNNSAANKSADLIGNKIDKTEKTTVSNTKVKGQKKNKTTKKTNNTTNQTTIVLVKTVNNNQSTILATNNNSQEQSTTTDIANKPIKKTRTIVSYQYSNTALKAMIQRRAKLATQLPNTNVFGISNETTIKKPFKVGVFAGVSTKVIGSTQKVSIMPTAGVTASYQLGGKHAIQTGLQYKSINLKGIQLKNEPLDNTTYRQYNDGKNSTKAYNMNRIDMLEIPLTYQYTPHPKFSVQAGIKGSFLFNKQSSNTIVSKMQNKKAGLVTFDLGMLLGMEVFVTKNISVGLQYSIGFMNLAQGAKNTHQKAIDQEPTHIERTINLTDSGEALVPINNTNDEMIRLPQEIRNNDLQLLVKYTF